MLPSSNNIFDLVWNPKLPILVSSPHSGREIPVDIAKLMTEVGMASPDTDSLIDELYELGPTIGVSLISANYSRYVVDLNRPIPGGEPLYPGQRNDTGVCPNRTFDNQPIYQEGIRLDKSEVLRRISLYYEPYYAAIKNLLTQLLKKFPKVLLFDAHSIRSSVQGYSEVPFADFMPGNRNGQTCPKSLMDTTENVLSNSGFTVICNDPFKGGNITRYFGSWHPRVYSLQLEMCKHLYLDELSGNRSLNFNKMQLILKDLLENLSTLISNE